MRVCLYVCVLDSLLAAALVIEMVCLYLIGQGKGGGSGDLWVRFLGGESGGWSVCCELNLYLLGNPFTDCFCLLRISTPSGQDLLVFENVVAIRVELIHTLFVCFSGSYLFFFCVSVI